MRNKPPFEGWFDGLWFNGIGFRSVGIEGIVTVVAF